MWADGVAVVGCGDDPPWCRPQLCRGVRMSCHSIVVRRNAGGQSFLVRGGFETPLTQSHNLHSFFICKLNKRMLYYLSIYI